MSICPECNDVHFTQQRDKHIFKCGGCGKTFRLVETKVIEMRPCIDCGKFRVLEPSGRCEECTKKLAERR